mgnify:CR=1 FL=1
MSEIETEETIEDPERGTAGLTSAIQVVDTTDSVTFDISNSSSALPEYLAPSPFPREKERLEESEIVIFKPLVSGPERFRQALKSSMKKNKDILKKLTEY